ncbi:MAG: hypothetical protein EXQ53_08605 [Acidobacteria bacterium]|nr:hypothetical protein [Acidobacteriota bacterium]
MDELLRVFKSVEAVSVILRFIWPEHYGILSAPVEHLLGTRSAESSRDIGLTRRILDLDRPVRGGRASLR